MPSGRDAYVAAVGRLQATCPAGKPKQQHSEAVALYREAAHAKPKNDTVMEDLVVRFKKQTGDAFIELSLCPTLKKISRIVEKSILKAKIPGDVSGVLDIVRCVSCGGGSMGMPSTLLSPPPHTPGVGR